VVLSRHSVEKPWVREELDSAFIKRIETGSKLIPVVIDDCEVPQALKSTLWEKIADLANYDDSFHRIVNAILGRTDKPDLGSLPAYVKAVLPPIEGLTQNDNLVLKRACEHLLDGGSRLIDIDTLCPADSPATLPKEVLTESLQILDQSRHIELRKVIFGPASIFHVTAYGFEVYCDRYVANYGDVQKQIAAEIVNNGIKHAAKLVQAIGQPIYFVLHVLAKLELHGHIQLSNENTENKQITMVSPSLARALANG
jgi:hypothetical protein